MGLSYSSKAAANLGFSHFSTTRWLEIGPNTNATKPKWGEVGEATNAISSFSLSHLRAMQPRPGAVLLANENRTNFRVPCVFTVVQVVQMDFELRCPCVGRATKEKKKCLLALLFFADD